jgi:hypothetical protein
LGWLSWCIKDLWGTKVMYCYVVKWPVFSLQRGSAKWPIAPSNFSSLCIRPFVCKEGFSAHEFLSELHDGIKPSIYIWHDLDISLLSHKTKSAATFSIWKAISQGTLTVLGYCSTLCIHRFIKNLCLERNCYEYSAWFFSDMPMGHIVRCLK